MTDRSNDVLRRTARLRRVTVIAAAFTLVAAACGGDDDDAASPTAAPATDAPAGETTPAAGSEAPSPGESTTTIAGATPDTTAATPAPDGSEPTRGGSAIVAMSGMPVTLDPQLHRVSFAFSEAAAASAVFGHLAYVDSTTGAVQLYFLESLEPNDDATVWTLKVHDGIKFSDGTPLDAEAIKFNIERAADPDTGSRFRGATEGLELEVLDELTLEVTLPGPDPAWNSVLVANFAGVGSPTAIQAAIDEGVEVGTRPVGAGPFMVKDWDPGQTLTLERNPYFEEFRPGQPYLDELVIENIADRSQMTTAIQTGAVQIALTSGGGHSQALDDVANTVVTYSGGGASIHLNHRRPPFDDPRARLALALALDKEITSDAFAPGTEPSTGLFSESSPFYNPEYTWPAQDKEEAQRLFDELAAEGKPVEFSYTTYQNAEQTNMVDTLIAQLAEFDNVTFTPDVRTYSEYVTASTTREFQSLAWGTYFTTPLPMLKDEYHPDGILNYAGWDNDEVRAALDELTTAFTVEDQKPIWDIVQREMVEDTPFVWLGKGVLTIGYVDGLVPPLPINMGTFPLWPEVGFE